ncbi:MAG: deaminase [Acidobacteriota bacterium]
MKLAIEEMLLARSEHLDKPDPLVGAVLVSRGRTVDRAHRGQFRDGEHGEYTLLERLVTNVDPSGCTLYVTLEPCSERNPPKKPCAMRIVEKGIRRVVIGMLDPYPRIHRQGVGYLLDHGVEVRFFDGDLREVIRQENQEFIAHYEQSDYSAEMAEEAAVALGEPLRRRFSGAEREETRSVRSARVEDFDADLIREYLAAQQLSHQVPSEELWRDFLKRGFVVTSLEDRVLVPTLAGILLFGKDPASSVPPVL